MSTNVENSRLSSTALPAPHLRLVRFEDYEEIARHGLAHRMINPPFNDWRSLWLDNPLWQRVGKDWPIGWVLQTATGEIVGTFMNIPSLYRFRGQPLICGNGKQWGVTAAYRGYSLWLIDEYFNQPGVDLFINTTVGEMAAPHLARLSTRIPLGDWDAVSYWLTGYVGLTRNKLRRLHVPVPEVLAYPASWALRLKDAVCNKPLPKIPRDFSIDTADQFDSQFDAFWDELVRQNPEKLLAERTSHTLSWHFGISMRRGQLWILTASLNRRLRAYCVLKNVGGEGRCVDLIDYQTVEPEIDLLPGLLRTALQRCAKEDIGVLQNYGRGVPKMQALDECAPYNRKLETWRFVYRAANPSLDSELRTARLWDPGRYDGDSSLV